MSGDAAPDGAARDMGTGSGGAGPGEITPPPIPDTPESGVVEVPKRCITCSYSLLGLPVAGVCPECGTEVAKSLRGNLLIHSDPTYLKRLHDGVFIVQAGVIVMVVGSMLGIALMIVSNAARHSAPTGWSWAQGAMTAAGAGLGLVTAALTVVGWLGLSAADPRAEPTDRGERPRRVLRAALWVEAGAVLCAQSLALVALSVTARSNLSVALASLAFGVVQVVAFAVRYFASMQYIRWLSMRLPNPTVQVKARRMLWLGPLLITVGSLCLYLGPIVALVLYYNLLDLVRQNLKQIRARVAVGDVPGSRVPA